MDDHHHHLTIMTLRHQRRRTRVSWRRRSGVTMEKLVGGHREKHVLVPTMADEKHTTGGIEAEHRVLPFERTVRLFQIHFKGEPLIGGRVRKEGREPNAIGHSKIIVYHGFVCVHENLAGAERDAILVVDDHFASAGEKVHRILVLIVVKLLEGGELEGFHG